MPEGVVWIDADGNELDLHNGTDVWVLTGMEGRESPKWDIVIDESPARDGSQVRFVKSPLRDIKLPLLIRGATRAAFQQKLRQLAQAFNPVRGAGRLQVTSADGVVRSLQCRYIDGLEKEEASPTVKKTMITFKAFDPFWESGADIVCEFTLGSSIIPFFPFPPLVLKNSSLFGEFTTINDGDVQTWPVWTIQGPGINPALYHNESTKNFRLTLTLEAGQSVVIDTRPGQKSVTLWTGENGFPLLADDSALWPLETGTNTIRVIYPNADANSQVSMTYRNRYLTP